MYADQYNPNNDFERMIGIGNNQAREKYVGDYRNRIAAERGTMPNNSIGGMFGLAQRKPMGVDEQIAQAQESMGKVRDPLSQKTKKSYSWDDYGSWGG